MLKRILLSSFYLCVMSSLTATWAAAQPFAAAPEMFEHGPPPSDDGPKDRSGTIIGTVKLKADLKNAQEFVLNIPRLPPGRLRIEAVQARSERNYSFSSALTKSGPADSLRR